MAQNAKTMHPVGRRTATPPRKAHVASPAEPLALPHERDESSAATAAAPDAVMVQAKADLDAGMVDTDLRATPGLDAERREQLVPGPGGRQRDNPSPEPGRRS